MRDRSVRRGRGIERTKGKSMGLKGLNTSSRRRSCLSSSPSYRIYGLSLLLVLDDSCRNFVSRELACSRPVVPFLYATDCTYQLPMCVRQIKAFVTSNQISEIYRGDQRRKRIDQTMTYCATRTRAKFFRIFRILS